ncbi:MAG: deoxyribose-phosphate aldolase [Gammaproteobacteria bacterium]
MVRSSHTAHFKQASLEQIDAANQAMHLLDLTNLDENAEEHHILYLTGLAVKYHVAAVCVYPKYISIARSHIHEAKIKVATVANFPTGDLPEDTVAHEIESAINAGADEIDVVFPYKKYLAGDVQAALSLVKTAKNICGSNILLKVILETGAFNGADDILHASRDVIASGADFIKTSTGKIPQGASLVAAIMMLSAIKEAHEQNRQVGLKISGGVRHLDQVLQYFALAREIISSEFIHKDTFRIGASSLLDELVKYASGTIPTSFELTKKGK